jgi:Tfp pilus assembly protein PilF
MQFYEYGVAHAKPGLWAEGLPALEWAVRIDPRQTMGHYQLALHALNIGDPQRALESINEVLEKPEHLRRARTSPTFYRLCEMRGHIYSNLGEYEKSKQDFRRAVELKPSDGKLWHWLCWTHLELGELDQALAAGLKAFDLGFRTYESTFKVGMVYKKMGRLEEAERYFRESLNLHRGNTAVYKNLGEILAKMGRKEEGEEMARMTRTLAEVDDHLHKLRQSLLTAEHLSDDIFQRDTDLYATTCYQYFKFPELADAMSQLLARDPNNPEYHFKMAYARFELREEVEADEHYRHALMLLDLKRRQGEVLTAKEKNMEISAMNSLASLLISARDPELRRPAEAAVWAERARQLGYPHADFLAKALLVGGRPEEGLEIVTKALEALGGESPLRPVYEDLRKRLQSSLSGKEMERVGAGESP